MIPKARNDRCTRCGELETGEHLFIECPENRKPLEMLEQKAYTWKIRPPKWTMRGVITTFLYTKQQHREAALCASMLGLIWRTRNHLKYRNSQKKGIATFMRNDWNKTMEAIEPKLTAIDQRIEKRRERARKARREALKSSTTTTVTTSV